MPVRVTAPRFELMSQRQKVSRLPTEPPGRQLINVKHTHTHKIVVDAVRETVETRVESEKNVEKKGLVQ